MIGKAYTSLVKFYDVRNNKMAFKRRPVLVIGSAYSNGYSILPISRVTNRNNLHNHYDVKLEPALFPAMNLTECSYVRTHKLETIHQSQLVKEITDFKSEYPDTYLDILSKLEEFQKELISTAL